MKTVVICGSHRFKEEIKEFAGKLVEMGVTVYTPHHHSSQNEWGNLSPDYQKFVALGLTHDHFYKISMADIVFVYNKNGYIGPSTTLEIGFAAGVKKPIYALSPDTEELCRHTLFREIISTPEELLKYLK